MIRWGMIGCGAVTEMKSAPALQLVKDSRLIAVMSRTAERVADYAIERHYTDARALIEDPDVDAIYIATPPSTHCSYALQCAAAGKPVYVEKPMARNHGECLQMLQACEGAGVALFVAYYRRALPSFDRIRELIRQGAIGEVRAVSCRLSQPLLESDRDPATRSWHVQPAVVGGGRFVDLGSHMLDYLDHALGPLVVEHALVSNQAGAYEAEDIVSAQFTLGNGAVVSGLWCFSTHERVDRTEIIGSHGSITFSNFRDQPFLLRTPAREQTIHIPWPRHVQQPLIESVVDALHGRGECASTGTTAARTNAVIDRVLAHRLGAATPHVAPE
jgi:1,5-anhydro-D-fructose reductase (1,5-anhydro-D-mannitol-forming)